MFFIDSTLTIEFPTGHRASASWNPDLRIDLLLGEVSRLDATLPYGSCMLADELTQHQIPLEMTMRGAGIGPWSVLRVVRVGAPASEYMESFCTSTR